MAKLTLFNVLVDRLTEVTSEEIARYLCYTGEDEKLFNLRCSIGVLRVLSWQYPLGKLFKQSRSCGMKSFIGTEYLSKYFKFIGLEQCSLTDVEKAELANQLYGTLVFLTSDEELSKSLCYRGEDEQIATELQRSGQVRYRTLSTKLSRASRASSINFSDTADRLEVLSYWFTRDNPVDGINPVVLQAMLEWSDWMVTYGKDCGVTK